MVALIGIIALAAIFWGSYVLNTYASRDLEAIVSLVADRDADKKGGSK